MRYVSRSSFPLGALAGRFLGTPLGPQLALVAGACGMLAGALWVLRSPIRKLTAASVEDPAGPGA